MNRLTVDEPVAAPSETSEQREQNAQPGPIRALRYAVFDLFGAIDLWILAGVLAAALISTLVPADYFSGQAWSQGILGMLVVLAISLPLYVCTTGSVPIAASLIAAGMPAGSALVFLMAGPATNVATIGAVYRALGGRVLSIYLGTVILMSMAMGLGFEFVLGDAAHTHASHAHGPGVLSLVSSLLVIGLMLFLLGRRLRRRLRSATALRGAGSRDLILEVEGMTCEHCVSRVKRTLEAFDSVDEATPSLSAGRVLIRGGHLDATALAEAVQKAGYKASPRT